MADCENSTQQESEYGGINPLDIPKILQQTISYLDIRSLKCCRLVNSAWNHEAVLSLREKNCLLLNGLKDFAKFNDAFETGDSERKHFPYKSCVFRIDLLDPDCPDFIGFHAPAQNFLEKFGRYFTQVHISLGRSNQVLNNFLKNLFDNWFTNVETISFLVKDSPFDFFEDWEERELSNVKNVHVQWVGFHPNMRDVNFYNFLVPIFVKSENLEKISNKMPAFNNTFNIGGPGIPPYSSLSDLVLKCILSQYFRQKGLTRLNEIEVLLKVGNEELLSLTDDLPFNLETVYLELEKPHRGSGFPSFLRKYEKTLRKLHLEMRPKPKISSFLDETLVENKLEFLKELCLVNYSGNLSFLNAMPVLKILEIQNEEEFSFKTVLSESVEILKLVSRNTLITSESLGLEIANTFPYLRELQIEQIRNAGLQNIFEHLPQLRGLRLKGKFSDEGICGDTDSVLKVLLESAVEDPENHVWDFHPRFPCIQNLKDLQHCSIEADLITDACLAFGVSRCQKLKIVHVKANLELITQFGLNSLKRLEDLEILKVNVRKKGTINLDNFRLYR